MSTGFGPLRIGEFARRVDVNPDLLRAWERRYGLLQPLRSPGGFRLYSEDDAERVARMRRALDEGLSAAEAARAALAGGLPAAGILQDGAGRLLAAIERYDETDAHAVLDAGLAACGLETVLRDVIFPTLRRFPSRRSRVRPPSAASAGNSSRRARSYSVLRGMPLEAGWSEIGQGNSGLGAAQVRHRRSGSRRTPDPPARREAHRDPDRPAALRCRC